MGTNLYPDLLANGDVIDVKNFVATDGTKYVVVARIQSKVDGTPAPGGAVPTKLEFWTTNSSGTLTLAFTLDAAQLATFAGAASIAGTLAVTGATTLSGNTNSAAGAGITGGSGTVFKTSVVKVGSIITTSILIDIQGLGSSTTDLDIIGTGTSAAHMGQITAARNGTILAGTVTCLKVPTTGVVDIDLYSATEATGKFDDAVSGLTETALLTSGGNWTLALTKALGSVPAANEYLYLTCGAAGVPGTYGAGQFLINLYGY